MVIKPKIIPVLLLGLSLVLLPGLSAQKSISVRVAIIQNAPSVKLRIRGAYEITTLQTEGPLYKGKNLRTSRILPTSAGIKISNMDFKVYSVKIIPATSGNIYINGRRFRGKINIIRQKDLKLLIVNDLDLEEYIKGVLYHEVSHRWPLEAIKAQAVVARTYAVYQTRISKLKDYDLTCDIYSQVYGGKTSETWRTSRAVEQTRREVLTYNGDIFPTFYHATCGGHTEDASVLWKVDLPPLKGVECKFCAGSPHFRWSKELSAGEIEEKLAGQGIKVSGLEDVLVAQRDNSDRVLSLELVTAAGKQELAGKDFRQIFGPNIIRSTNFEIKKEGNKFVINGIGWGHGVGMCQWGAYFQSLEGRKYDQILQYYYPGAVIKKLE
jgi:stage II sporulation protein D